MAGVGLLVDQHVPQPLRRGRGGGQIDRRADESEEAGGGQPLCHQVHRIQAPVNSVRNSCFTEFAPETEIYKEKPDGHDGHPGVPDIAQQISQSQFLILYRCFIVLNDPDLGVGWRDRQTGGKVRGLRMVCQRFPVCWDVKLLAIQLFCHRLSHRLCRRQQRKVYCRQMYRHQQPHQHQKPQGILDPPGDGAAEQHP